MAERIAVVGGGISGLTTAYKEKKNGNNVTLFESSSNVGGKISTIYSEGFELDLGPVTVAETTELHKLIIELGLEAVEASNASAIRYIYSKGKLHRVGKNPISGTLLSFGGKLSMLKAPLTSKQKENETVATYAKRRFGDQAYQRLFNPMMNGIYAGDSELICANAVLKKQKPRKIISVKGGFKKLTDALALKLGDSIKTCTTIKDFNSFDKIYFTTPAFVTAELIKGLDSNLADKLKRIHYSSLSQIYCEVVPGEINFDGFGFLVPSEERMSLLGAVCVSNIFPEKAPHGKMMFVLFCGGDRPYNFNPSITGALAEFKRILEPAFLKVLHIQEWKDAIPQFYVGHNKIVEALRSLDPKIVFKGSYVTGVAVGDCI